MNDAQIYTLLTEVYSLVLVTTPDEIQAVKMIREEVFSPKLELDKAYLRENNFVHDNNDEHSFIFLLKHNKTHRYVGTVRVIFFSSKTPSQRLHIQDLGINIEHLTIDLPICEISRLALCTNLEKDDHLSPLKLSTYLALGLMIATRVSFFLYPPIRVFATMEKSLDRVLRRQNVNFERIGDPVNIYGLRTPYAIKKDLLLTETEDTMGRITRYYLQQMCRESEKLWQFVDNNIYLDRSDIQLERICKLFQEYGDNVDIRLLLGENKG